MEIVLITVTSFDNIKNKKITKGNKKMEKISAEALLRAFVDPLIEENLAQFFIKNPELEQTLDLAISRIKSKMPFFKKPVYKKSLTEDEVLNICKNHEINMNRKNFRGNYLEKELAKYNSAYFHEDLNAWEYDYEYISHWVPLLLDKKHELRNKVVLSMDKKSEITVTETGFDGIVVEAQDLNEESTQTEKTTKSINKTASHFTALLIINMVIWPIARYAKSGLTTLNSQNMPEKNTMEQLSKKFYQKKKILIKCMKYTLIR